MSPTNCFFLYINGGGPYSSLHTCTWVACLNGGGGPTHGGRGATAITMEGEEALHLGGGGGGDLQHGSRQLSQWREGVLQEGDTAITMEGEAL